MSNQNTVNTANTVVKISSAERKNMIDNIVGALVAFANTANAQYSQTQEEAQKAARATLEERIERLFCGVYAIPKSAVQCVVDDCLMRATKYTKGDFAACSGSVFRKWVLQDMLVGHFGIDLEAHAKTKEATAKRSKRTIKEADGTVRPMTEEELRQWDENRLAKLQKEMDAIYARMGK